MTDAAVLPNIFDYMDYRLFLKDQLEYLQSRDRKFSQRWVAKRAGFKAPQLLSMIVQGHRNLTRDKITDLGEALKLNPREQEYFAIVVELATCDGREAQERLVNRIQTGFRDGLFRTIDDDGAELFRDWYYPALREMVTLKGATADAQWMAEQLGVSPSTVQEALDVLIGKGFLHASGKGKLERAHPSIGTQNKIFPMLLGSWHMKMLERAFMALRLPRHKRYFEGYTFAMPKRLMPELKELTQRFIREVDTLVEAQQDRDEVCHLHIELFPLTRWQDSPAD